MSLKSLHLVLFVAMMMTPVAHVIGAAVTIKGFPDATVHPHPNWPAGLVETIESRQRVWVTSFFGFGNVVESHFYKGDTDSFNAFLKVFKDIEQEALSVIIHAGNPRRQEELANGYTWVLRVRQHSAKKKEDVRYSAGIEIWLTKDIELHRVIVPKSIEVRSAGDIKRFIERRQKKLGKQQQAAADNKTVETNSR